MTEGSGEDSVVKRIILVRLRVPAGAGGAGGRQLCVQMEGLVAYLRLCKGRCSATCFLCCVLEV